MHACIYLQKQPLLISYSLITGISQSGHLNRSKITSGRYGIVENKTTMGLHDRNPLTSKSISATSWSNSRPRAQVKSQLATGWAAPGPIPGLSAPPPRTSRPPPPPPPAPCCPSRYATWMLQKGSELCDWTSQALWTMRPRVGN